MCFSLDREAFSFTNYDLNVQVDPEQHRLGVRGKITLRNDSSTPQKIAVLQISSSLDWRSIKAGDKAVQFVTQPYTSDIDHTGGLSEAIVTLPHPSRRRRPSNWKLPTKASITARCDAADAHRYAGGRGEQHGLGPDRCEVHGGARRGICGVVSDCDRGGESVGGEQFV